MIEQIIIAYLSDVLTDVSVVGDVPSPTPFAFVTVEQTGSYEENLLTTATVAIQSWAVSRAEAAKLNERVKNAMDDMITLDTIVKSKCNSDYNYTDTQTKHNRYQAVYDVVYYRR